MLFGLLCVCMASCGSGDDDDNYSGGEGSNAPKRIVKIVTEEGGSISETTISYDSQGRVIKAVGIENGYRTSTFEMNYQYGELFIISKEIENGTYSNGQNYTWSETHTYTVSNRLIVKDVEVQTSNGNKETTNRTFSYDNNGYMSSLESISSSGSYNEKWNWTDGNLMSTDRIYQWGSERRTYSYSNVPWNKSMLFGLKGTNIDGYLWTAGYLGKCPRYLPSSYNNGYIHNYQYTVSDRLVTKVTDTFSENGHEKINITTITWE